MTPAALEALAFWATPAALLSILVLLLTVAIVARRHEKTEERLADMRLRVFALAELLRDDADRDGDWGRLADRLKLVRSLEALFPEIIRFEPVTREDFPASAHDLWPDTLAMNVHTGEIRRMGEGGGS